MDLEGRISPRPSKMWGASLSLCCRSQNVTLLLRVRMWELWLL